MRVLVTGGAGFIGSHVVDQLVEHGVEVVVLDSLAVDVHPGEPAYLHPEVRLVRGDVADERAWRLAIGDGVDAVCHQAARVGLGVDFGDVRRYVADNDVGTAVGLGVLHDVGFTGRMVLASSMVVYGEGRYRCDEHGPMRAPPREVGDLDAGRYDPRCPRCGHDLSWAPVSESDPVDPRNVYAATKLHQEHLCEAFARHHDVAVAALRYHNVYGPRMPRDTPYAGVASIFRSAVESGRAPVVLEDGRQMRDFVHVRDVARANVAALLTDRPHHGPLNIASGHPHTVAELADALVDAVDGNALRPVVAGGYRLGDVRHVVASPEAAKSAIGFRAEVSFADGVAEFATAALR
ncbi:MAG: NAD-dependent epimerase/dehydratase family protein [Microthrixaceae bacterium]|nr:NAD-dependent epimerase/dehydratase family protein [Microthrixaceae bacterium]